MRNEPYAGMGNVSKAEGLYLQKKGRKKETALSSEHDFFFSKTKEGYSMIPNELIWDKVLKKTAKLTYIAGVSVSDTMSRETFSGRKRVGEIVGINPDHISTQYKQLRVRGWATIIRRGAMRTNIIIFHSYRGQKISEKEKKSYLQTVEKKIEEWRRNSGF